MKPLAGVCLRILVAAAVAALTPLAEAGHTNPKRKAGNILAIAEAFAEHCRDRGKLDPAALTRELETLGVAARPPESDPVVEESLLEFKRFYRDAIEKEGVEAFCRIVLETYADGEPRLFIRRN